MHLKTPQAILVLLLAIAFTFTLSGAPLVTIGDNINIFFNGSSSARFVSNVFLDTNDEESDTIFIFSPGFEVSIGREGGSGKVSFFYREDFWVYADNDDLDNNNSNFTIDAQYATPKLELGGVFEYYETDQSTADTRRTDRLIEREITKFDISAEHTMSPKFSVVGGYHFYKENFVSSDLGFRDRESHGFPINVYYNYSPKLGIGIGYRYRQTNVYDDPDDKDRDDNFFNVGLRGELAPKLDTDLKVGVQNRDIEGSDDDTTFAILSRFTWQASPKATMITSFNRDFATGGEGNSIENTGIDVSFDYAFSPLVLGHTGFKYNNADYNNSNSRREDDYYYFDVSVRYSPNEYLGFSAEYIYQNNDSNQRLQNFDNNILNLTATLRY